MRHSGTMDAETLSVWLIGAGALTIVLGLVFASERAYEGVSMRGPFSTRDKRLRFAVEAAGATLVAAGSILLAATSSPSAWLLLIPVAAYALAHLLAAWKLGQYWRFRSDEASRAAAGDDANELQRDLAVCASSCASWGWCLRHPFNDEYWPRAELDAAQRDRVGIRAGA